MTRGVAVARRCRRAGWWRGELGRARRVPPLFVLLAEEEEDKGEEVGWAGQMELGQVSGAR